MQPESYTEFIASILLLIAVLFSFGSLWSKIRPFSLKLFAILLVAVMAIFSNYWITYIAAIFIIATAVTELEFLQNLAAIISKNKHYFKYKREFMTRDEVEKKTANSKQQDKSEQNEEATTNENQKTIHDNKIPPKGMQKTPLSKLLMHSNLEFKALKWLKLKKNLNVQEFVRFSNELSSVELDGFVDGGEFLEDQIIEVKVVQNKSPLLLTHDLGQHQAVQAYYKYTEITKRKARLIFIYIFMNEEVKKNFSCLTLLNSRIPYDYYSFTNEELDKELNL